MNANRLTMIATVIAATSIVVGCTRAVVYKENDVPLVAGKVEPNGPPSHAPAHGYRLKHARDGVELMYDADIDVYVVVGYEDCWYTAGQYFRLGDHRWEWSVNVEGPWKVVAHESDVPPGLRHPHGHGRKVARNK